MANFLPPAVIEIKAIADKAIAEFKQVNNELEKMEKEADKAGGGINRMEQASKIATGVLIGLGTAFAGFAAVGIKEAMQAEIIMAKLSSTMTAAGVNTEKNRAAVEKLSESYVQLGFDDEAAAAGFENLLRVTGDLEQSQKLLALSADLARTKNIGLAEASSILAKASTGNAKAFKEAGITLDTTIPKAQAVAKAFDELNDKIGTQAENATKTFAVQLQIVKEQFNNTAQSLGSALLPVLKTMLEKINQGVEFVKRHSDAFKVLGGIFLTVTVALAAYNATVKVQMALTKAWSVVTGIQAAVTKLLTGQQVALNTAMKLNPIGLVVSAAMLLVGAFVLLWNKSETFRKAVIAVGKAGLMAFSSIIPIIGKVGEAILKVVFAPLKALLSALSKLPGVGKYAKAGLDILNKGLDGVSDFADKASAKAKALAANLDKLNKPIKINISGMDGIPTGDKGTGKGKGKGGLTPEEKKEIDKKNKEYQDAVKDLNDKVAAARKKYDDTVAKSQKAYNEKVAAANKKHNEAVASARARFAEADMKARSKAAEDMLQATKKRDEGIAKAEAEAKAKRLEAQTIFNDKMGELNAKKAEDLAKLEKDNASKIQAIYKANAEKLQAIVQQSIDRLRSAYQRGTDFSVTELFKGLVKAGQTTADNLLNELKKKLSGAQTLAANASKLAGLGFSQTFIEQVVSAGPEVGNELADSILKATPETIKELQTTFKAMETQTNTGLDKLATEMNKGANLATDELNKAYAEAQKELGVFLAEQAADYAAAQAEINKEFSAQMAEAEKTRDAALAAAEADLTATLAAINKEFNERTAEINKELNDALAEANKDLNDALADAAKDLKDALEDAAKDLADALADAKQELTDTLDALAKEFEEKLGKIQNATKATIAAINALKAAMASAAATGSSGGSGATGGTPTVTAVKPTTPYIPITSIPRAVPADGSVASWRAGEERSMAALNINQTFNTDYVDPIQVKTQMLNAMKYGSTVQIPASLRSRGID